VITGNFVATVFASADGHLCHNLYTVSLVTLDADTGERCWHYQFTPHDVHDWDSRQVPALGDLTFNGRPRNFGPSDRTLCGSRAA